MCSLVMPGGPSVVVWWPSGSRCRRAPPAGTGDYGNVVAFFSDEAMNVAVRFKLFVRKLSINVLFVRALTQKVVEIKSFTFYVLGTFFLALVNSHLFRMYSLDFEVIVGTRRIYTLEFFFSPIKLSCCDLVVP